MANTGKTIIRRYDEGDHMSVYNMGFSEKLTDAARVICEDGLGTFDANQTVAYLSLLSCEITLKALLEKAGMSVKDIKARSHNLKALLNDFSKCEVEGEIDKGYCKWVPATRIRSLTIQEDTDTTIGKLLTGESQGASKYPNEIRYGERFSHFPPEALMQAAIEILKWAHIHFKKIRLSS